MQQLLCKARLLLLEDAGRKAASSAGSFRVGTECAQATTLPADGHVSCTASPPLNPAILFFARGTREEANMMRSSDGDRFGKKKNVRIASPFAGICFSHHHHQLARCTPLHVHASEEQPPTQTLSAVPNAGGPLSPTRTATPDKVAHTRTLPFMKPAPSARGSRPQPRPQRRCQTRALSQSVCVRARGPNQTVTDQFGETEAPFRSKVDGHLPATQRANSRIVRPAD